MDYNESAQRVDKAFDELFRSLDSLEYMHHSGTQDDIMDAAFRVNNSWREYKEVLKAHVDEFHGVPLFGHRR